jgi:hypothetical protein
VNDCCLTNKNKKNKKKLATAEFGTDFFVNYNNDKFQGFIEIWRKKLKCGMATS